MEKDLIKEYYKNSTKYLDGMTWDVMKKHCKISLIPYLSGYSLPLRKVEGSSTYFCNKDDNCYIIGKYIGYATPDILRIHGIPVYDEENMSVNGIVKGVEKLDYMLRMDNRIEALLNKKEIALINKIKGNLPYELEYFDSDFYDDVDEFLEKHKSGKGRQRLKGMLNDENVIFREISYSDYTQVKNFVIGMRKEKGKEYYRSKFYDTLIADWKMYDYEMYGLFYKNILMYVMGFWRVGNVARADMIMSLKTDDEYEKLSIPKKYRRGSEYTFKYILYRKLKDMGIDILSVDGVGYRVDKGDGLREHKKERYNRELEIYRVRYKGD